MTQSHIRNFCIIAHIDHGKSTLADRLLETTGTVDPRQMKNQLLDSMDLEREKGITIKLAPVRMNYRPAANSRAGRSAPGFAYQLNLIDTPGHVDFSYEVSRSLAACEGALLVVDASQGIQAQTLANVYLALEANLTIIPVLNKIDLPAADPDKVGAELVELLGCRSEDVLRVSAKTGQGINEVLRAVVERVPPPGGAPEGNIRALVFDSVYDDYRGVILYCRVFDGSLASGQEIKMMAAGSVGAALELGYLHPNMTPDKTLSAGEIGYVVTNFRSVSEGRVGDTLTGSANPAKRPLSGYREVKPFVYAGLFPASAEHYPQLKDALEKLSLNDSALQYTPETSQVLGHGFRIGFLGMLHMDIVRERLERDYRLELIVTSPSTDYRVKLAGGGYTVIRSAAELPDPASVVEISEPWMRGEIVTPAAYVGALLQLVASARGRHGNISYGESGLAVINFEAPLPNTLSGFYDKLKSLTSGYGSYNYELTDYRPEDLVRLDCLVAGERADALSVIVHRGEAARLGRQLVEKLKEVIPKQLFVVSLQAAVNGKIIAREDIPALKKNVTGHLYGGDVSRKKKLWAKQKEGKKRLKKFGKVDIPADAFRVLLNQK